MPQHLHQTMDLARVPVPYLSRYLTTAGISRAAAAARIGLTKAAVGQACRPQKPSLNPEHLRVLATDPATGQIDRAALFALLADRAERLATPRVDVDYSQPTSLAARLALIVETYRDDEPALRAAVATLLAST